MRSQTSYPATVGLEIFETIKVFWEKGIFDDYSEKHFIIRAINNDASYFKELFLRKNIKEINPTSFPWNFIANLNVKTVNLMQCFGNDVIENFFRNQFAAGKNNYNENQFFEALSEFYLLTYFANFGPAKLTEAIYEPRLVDSDKNPEARFVYGNDVVLDIEIKTPNFPDRNLLENFIIPTYLLNDKGREKLSDFCNTNNINCHMPRILKIKDFINYAGEKFADISSENHINLLVINWTSTDLSETELFEPTTLLCNPKNGLFRNKDVALKLGISEEALSKISAIFFYILPERCLLFNDFRYLFATKQYKIIVNPFAKDVSADKIHKLTHLAVHFPEELEDERFAFFSLDNRDWDSELREMNNIINENTL